MVKVLPEPVTPSSACSRSMRPHARHQLADRGWLIAARLEIRLDDERPAALALLRTRRPVRHEHRHTVAGKQRRVVADGRQLAELMRRLRHGAGRLQIAQRWDEMLGALRGVNLALERRLRAFRKARAPRGSARAARASPPFPLDDFAMRAFAMPPICHRLSDSAIRGRGTACGQKARRKAPLCEGSGSATDLPSRS